MQPPARASRTLDPHHFGFLTDGPVLDTGTHELFPGDDRILSGAMRRKKRELLEAVGPHLDRCLDEGEKVLYVAAAQQMPTLVEHLGLGWWFYSLHRTVLVFTDRRLVEVLMDLRGTRPGTRVRAFAWSGLRKVKRRIGGFRIVPDGGRAASWRVPARADRKVLSSLLEKIEAHVQKVPGPPESTVRWHCPECGADNRPEPSHCVHCGTRFRSPRMAAALSLALPGGGLFYAGRPILAAIDLIGELFLFSVIAIALATAGSDSAAVAMAMLGLFLIAITKLESVHISRILVRRTVPETEGYRQGWKIASVAGAVLSAGVLVAAATASGTMAPTIDRDLTFTEGVWQGTRQANEFVVDDLDQRSQWTHADGTTVVVSAYSLGMGESWPRFRQDYLALMGAEGSEPLLLDERVPSGFTGFRCFVPVEDEDGSSFVALNYMLYDETSEAVHHVYTFSDTVWLDATSRQLAELVDSATWTSPTEPSL